MNVAAGHHDEVERGDLVRDPEDHGTDSGETRKKFTPSLDNRRRGRSAMRSPTRSPKRIPRSRRSAVPETMTMRTNQV